MNQNTTRPLDFDGMSDEEKLKAEFEKNTQNDINAGYQEPNIIRDLGKVEPQIPHKANIDEVERLQKMVGSWFPIDMSKLPSGGRFYRDTMRIMIRPAKVKEIKDFSMIDETDPRDINTKLNAILQACTDITYNNGMIRGSYKDILDADKFYIILSIRELTFAHGESSIMIPIGSKACNTPNCNSQEKVELKTNILQFESSKPEIEKYYDSVQKCYLIQTKKYGSIRLAPPTIGVSTAIYEYLYDLMSNKKSYDEAYVKLIPFLYPDWKQLNADSIFEILTQMQGWDLRKFEIILNLVEMINVGIKSVMHFECENCGAEVTVPLSFPNGIRNLFVESFSDIAGELL